MQYMGFANMTATDPGYTPSQTIVMDELEIKGESGPDSGGNGAVSPAAGKPGPGPWWILLLILGAVWASEAV